MIDLSKTSAASPLVHTVTRDPGSDWKKDSAPAIDAPPDDAVNPAPDAAWPPAALRRGIFGAVSPRVVVLPDGSFRLYYTQLIPRPGHPARANDYDNVSARILSAHSSEGLSWKLEPGVRVSASQGGAGEFRVVSSEVIPALAGRGKYRMYFECCRGPQASENSIRSAISNDGLEWTVEDGMRFAAPGRSFSAPRLVFLQGGACRLYCGESRSGIVSAISEDGGLTFREEPGVRIRRDNAYDAVTAFAPEIVRLDGGRYVMYYAGYGAPNRAHILRATSNDGRTWQKDSSPAVSPTPHGLDAAKCSEMCVFPAANGGFRMLHEGCDGTAPDQRGAWRILGATSAQECGR